VTIFFLICALTSVIAFASVLWASHSLLHRHALPWTAGALLGISIFWILPEMAQDRGWIATLTGVSGVLLLLALIDRYVYPICPFCAVGAHADESGHGDVSCRHAVTVGWPLLVFACVHVFFDGWTIALSATASHSSAAEALSWAVTIHKIPESVAIGVLTARLASSRKTAIAAVFLIQAVMTAGGVFSVLAGRFEPSWAQMSAVPACAFLLLFGWLVLRQEWQSNGRLAAMRAAAPGVIGSGIAALAVTILAR
jgi:zinc transporter ZupT